MTAQLPPGWTVEDDETDQSAALPPGWTLDPEENKHGVFEDVTSAEQREAGYEPEASEEFERAAELGQAEAMRGFLSGATLGISSNIPGFKPESGNVASETGRLLGSTIPLSGMFRIFGPAVTGYVAKSPILSTQLQALGNIFTAGLVGSTEKYITDLTEKHKIPSPIDVLEHGAEWSLLDAALRGAGKVFQFGKNLFNLFRKTDIPPHELINDIIQEAAEAGIELNQPDKVAAFAERTLDRMVQEAEQVAPERISLPETATTAESELAQKKLLEKRLTEEAAEGAPIELRGAPQTKEATVAQEALKANEITPQDLTTRNVTNEVKDRLINKQLALAEPVQPTAPDFKAESQALEKSAIEDSIDEVAPKPKTKEDFGNEIKKDIEANLEQRKAEVRPLYKTAKKGAERLIHDPKAAAKIAEKYLRKLEQFKTRPEGYGKTQQHLINFLEDMGYIVQRDFETGKIEQILKESDVTVADVIEMGSRLNEIIDFTDLEPTVQNILKKLVKEVKKEARRGLKPNPQALADFELAEKTHAQNAKIFGRNSIRNARKAQSGEKVGRSLSDSGNVSDLQKALTPEQFAKIQRELLDQINSENHKVAQETFDKYKKFFTAENRKLGKNIVDSKNPHNKEVREALHKRGVLADMSNAVSTGNRPERTLKLWRTEKGRKIVKDAFKDSPNWPEVREYLKDQSFNDLVESVMKDGKINAKKVSQFFQQPGNMEVVRDLGGQEAVEFFERLGAELEQLEKQKELFARSPSKADVKRWTNITKNSKGKERLLEMAAKENRIEKATHRVSKEAKVAKTDKEGQQLKFEPERPGQRRLQQAAQEEKRVERATQKLAEQADVAQKGLQPKPKQEHERGKKLLERMTKADFPYQTKMNEFSKWMTEALGLNERGLISVFGLMRLGLPNTVATMVGWRLMRKLATNPSVRKAFKQAYNQRHDTTGFLLAIETLADVMDETDKE